MRVGELVLDIRKDRWVFYEIEKSLEEIKHTLDIRLKVNT